MIENLKSISKKINDLFQFLKLVYELDRDT